MHLVPIVALALAAGILVDQPLVAGLLLCPVLLAPRLRRLVVPALAFLAGGLLSGPGAAGALVHALPEGSCLVHVTGRAATGADQPVHGRSVFVLEVATVGNVRIRGRIRVLVPEGAFLPAPGAKVAATGMLVRPRRSENPGESDAREALAARGITHLLLLKSPDSLTLCELAPALAPATICHRLRRSIEKRIAAIGDERTSAFLACLLIGRRDSIDERVARSFRRSGTAHFLAISGLHVGLLAGLLWMLFRALPLPRRAAVLFVALAALLYAGLTGFRPPAARAALLIAIGAAAVLCRRRPRPYHLLALAALFILFTDPGSLSRIGFQLSFAAVLSILHLTKPITEGLFARQLFLMQFSVPGERPWIVRALQSYLIRAIPVSTAAWLGTAPILLTEFGTLSLLVVPANLIVFPFIALLVPAGLLGILVGWLLPAAWLIRGLVFVVTGFAAIPWSCLTLPAPPLLLLILFYAALILAGRARSLGRGPVLLLLAGLASLAVSGVLLRDHPTEPRLTVLSVGHGLAAVLETPEGGVAVFDAGSRRPAIGRRTILPWLRHRKISALDALFLSHDDLDHTSGARELRLALPIGVFRSPGSLCAGITLSIPGARIEVLWPPQPVPDAGNDESTVLLVHAGGLSVLLPGDLEAAGLTGLLASGKDVRADVLVLPHHGHPNEMAAALVRAVGAKVLIASAGERAVLDAAYYGAIRTSEVGAITVFGGGCLVRPFRAPVPVPRQKPPPP